MNARIAAVMALLLLSACTDSSPTAPTTQRSLSSLVIVSSPSVQLSKLSGASSASSGIAQSRAIEASVDTLVYVSLPPGSMTIGDNVTVSNLATGEKLTAVMVEGGFDPAALAAKADDTLEIDVHSSGALIKVAFVIVPRRRPPTLVRTDPPKGKTDVPLNSQILVVFSEPVDPATAAGGLRLFNGSTVVAGTVTLSPSGIVADFTPDVPLAPLTSYELVVDTSVRNLRGDALDSPVHVSFTTASIAIANALYVANDGHGTGTVVSSSPIFQHGITVYTGGTAATIAGTNTGLRDEGPSGIAVDGVGRIYVAKGGGHNSILIYAPGARGDVAPVDTIFGSNTGLSYPQGVALDAVGRLYVTNIVPPPTYSSRITVYAPGASGNATPLATIAGDNTGLNGPIGIAVDVTGRLYVANANSITVYAAGANGDATPIATIQGNSTRLQRPVGLAVDAGGNIYVANFLACGDDIASQSILIFAAGDTGNAAPIATIQGSNTGLDGAYGIAVDAAGQLYVANATSCPEITVGASLSSLGSITVYARGANGNVRPVARIAGSDTGIFGPTWIAF